MDTSGPPLGAIALAGGGGIVGRSISGDEITALTDPLISRSHEFLNSFDYVSVKAGFFDWGGGGVHVTLDRNGYITWGGHSALVWVARDSVCRWEHTRATQELRSTGPVRRQSSSER